MIVQNECQKKCQGLHHDVEVLNIREASEDAGNHLEIIANSETDLHSQVCHTLHHAAWAHPCPSLHLQSQYTRLREERPQIYIDHVGLNKYDRSGTLMMVLPNSRT
jgi:hypothetical protein